MVSTHLDEKTKNKENNLELVFIEAESCGVFGDSSAYWNHALCELSHLFHVRKASCLVSCMEPRFSGFQSVGGQNPVGPAVQSSLAAVLTVRWTIC